MRSVLAGLRTLVLPWGAAQSQPAVVIGPDVPAELTTYYAAFGDTVQAAIMLRFSGSAYLYDALVTGAGYYRAFGRVSAGGTVEEFFRMQGGAGGPYDFYWDRTPINTLYGDGVNTFNWQYTVGANILTEGVIRAFSTGQIQAQTPGKITVDGVVVAASQDGVSAAAVTSGNDSTTSASYANLAGTGSQTSFSFTKRYGSSDTRIKVNLAASFFLNVAASTKVSFGVLINGTDTEIVAVLCNPISTHTHISATGYITGVQAGTYTVQGRWKRVSGAGTPTRDTNDWLTITAEEVA
jgi:hypothetical protein